MKGIAKRLLTWFDREQRKLPWRGVTDPWAIWVSEIMLQQTRVEVVRQLYDRFLREFPTPADLARADDDQLLTAWKGLGYYRRAHLLREGARQVVRDHGGVVPADADALGKLPGIGPYTRGAVASIAFGIAEPAIDGNVERVIARHRAIENNVKRGDGAAAVREFAVAWQDPRRAGDFNQALMELGALICTPRNPQCAACPVATDCQARRRGMTDQLPLLPKRPPMVDVAARAVLVPWSNGRVLATRIADGEINAGQIELPGAGILTSVESTNDLEARLAKRFGVIFTIGSVITTVRHGITNHRIRLQVHQARCAGPGPNLMAVRPDDSDLPWTTATRKAFQQASLFLTARWQPE